uniref:Uncharacterized protein n=1 Tax=Oryza sativa subsp. japonica TaxID=39947 RepID=Q2QRT6_ORYSJ|nr:hypothetical protein LOC_Os12g26460 [Oryza sativa Japonica Group]
MALCAGGHSSASVADADADGADALGRALASLRRRRARRCCRRARQGPRLLARTPCSPPPARLHCWSKKMGEGKKTENEGIDGNVTISSRPSKMLYAETATGAVTTVKAPYRGGLAVWVLGCIKLPAN